MVSMPIGVIEARYESACRYPQSKRNSADLRSQFSEKLHWFIYFEQKLTYIILSHLSSVGQASGSGKKRKRMSKHSNLSCNEVLYVLVQPRPRSTIMTDLTAEIAATATRRKLQARRLEASAPFWGCDDTLFECKSVSKMAPTCKISAKMANWRFFL